MFDAVGVDEGQIQAVGPSRQPARRHVPTPGETFLRSPMQRKDESGDEPGARAGRSHDRSLAGGVTDYFTTEARKARARMEVPFVLSLRPVVLRKFYGFIRCCSGGGPLTMATPATDSRIVSLDQFRGYTVAGMILVNYVGGFALTHPVLEHHNTYFSYADTIMPAFHFAVGFALRLTLLKRIERIGKRTAYSRVVRRCLGLILLSTILEYGTGGRLFETWTDLQEKGLWGALARPLKLRIWETLAILLWRRH
jgi:hypothetical protein